MAVSPRSRCSLWSNIETGEEHQASDAFLSVPESQEQDGKNEEVVAQRPAALVFAACNPFIEALDHRLERQ